MYSSQQQSDDYDFNYSIDLNTSSGPPGTASGNYKFGAKAPRMSTAMGSGGGGPSGASRMGTTSGQQSGDARPMTSVSGAGFSSKAGTNASRQAFDPLNAARGAAPALAEKADNSAEDMAKELEKTVHRLIEESAIASGNGEWGKALEKGKDAGKEERRLCKHRESNGLGEQINIDLTYAVWFNLANVYQQNGMMEEALNTYTLGERRGGAKGTTHGVIAMNIYIRPAHALTLRPFSSPPLLSCQEQELPPSR